MSSQCWDQSLPHPRWQVSSSNTPVCWALVARLLPALTDWRELSSDGAAVQQLHDGPVIGIPVCRDSSRGGTARPSSVLQLHAEQTHRPPEPRAAGDICCAAPGANQPMRISRLADQAAAPELHQTGGTWLRLSILRSTGHQLHQPQAMQALQDMYVLCVLRAGPFDYPYCWGRPHPMQRLHQCLVSLNTVWHVHHVPSGSALWSPAMTKEEPAQHHTQGW